LQHGSFRFPFTRGGGAFNAYRLGVRGPHSVSIPAQASGSTPLVRSQDVALSAISTTSPPRSLAQASAAMMPAPVISPHVEKQLRRRRRGPHWVDSGHSGEVRNKDFASLTVLQEFNEPADAEFRCE